MDTISTATWVSHPAVQSGLAPFITALITAESLRRLRLSGLAVIAGFCMTVWLVAGFDFEPLSATRKIILAGLVAAVAGLLADLIAGRSQVVRYLAVAGYGGTAVWVLWPVLQQKETRDLLVAGAGIVTFSMWIGLFTDRLADMPVRAGVAGTALGAGAGISALLGASALLGQMGIAVGAACGAYLLVQFSGNKPLSCGRTFTLPLALLCATVAPAAVLLANLPWYCLPVLAVIPVIVCIPLPRHWSVRQQVLPLMLLAGGCAAWSAYMVWRETGGTA